MLEPPAVAELLLYFGYDAFSALGLVEERSYAFGRIGEKVFDERFSLADDPLDPRGLPKAFDFEGTPKAARRPGERRRRSPASSGTAPPPSAPAAGSRRTGNAPPSSLRHWGPLPFALSVAGGEAETPEELAELVDDGHLRHAPPLPEHRRRRARA